MSLFKEIVLVSSREGDLALQDEFDQWERLSVEALVEFENGLPEARSDKTDEQANQ